MAHDLINGLFEIAGATLLLLNCRRMYHDKEVKGISVWPCLFFTTWGFWNLYFYPAVNAWLSFYGGLGVVAVNTTWLALTYYYKYLYRKPDHEAQRLAPPTTPEDVGVATG